MLEGKRGKKEEIEIDCLDGGGVMEGMENSDKSMGRFGERWLKFGIDRKEDVWFGRKDRMCKSYDGELGKMFEEVYEREYKEKFGEVGMEYLYRLIDDGVGGVMGRKGGLMWGWKKYEGDVMRDMVSRGLGCVGMMSCVLVCGEGKYEYEGGDGRVRGE